jgi:cephalosporin hydroxylase
MVKVAFISAIYGKYEPHCRAYVPPKQPADFICFTNVPDLIANGWELDYVPYHKMLRPAAWEPTLYNAQNKHTFCVAKFYKQSFYLIPRLAQYDIVVWVDGSLELLNPDVVGVLQRALLGEVVATYAHEVRGFVPNALAAEAAASSFDRYTSTHYFGQDQPVQDCKAQVEAYHALGYTPPAQYPHLWITCFVAWNMHHAKTRHVLNEWARQTLQYTTQDQIGFPYACWAWDVQPVTLPGDHGHNETDMYRRLNHATGVAAAKPAVPVVNFDTVCHLRELSTRELFDPAALHTVLSKLGFNNEQPHELPAVVTDNVGGMRIWQYPSQFVPYMLNVLVPYNIRSYIEIGCRWGGTFVLTVEYLQRLRGVHAVTGTAVDVINSPVREYCATTPNTTFMIADSHSSTFEAYVADKHYDLVFIDGDHSYEGVAKDFSVMEAHGDVFVFHDIVNDACLGVVRMWNELKATRADDFRFLEFTDQYKEVTARTGHSYLGIGVAVRLPPSP